MLFGVKVPAGRLIQTILPQAYLREICRVVLYVVDVCVCVTYVCVCGFVFCSYQNQISIFDFNMRPGPSVWPRPDCKVPRAQCPNGTNPGSTSPKLEKHCQQDARTGFTIRPLSFLLASVSLTSAML